jgi:uncharacterized protein YjbI with pentapeptide repeats
MPENFSQKNLRGWSFKGQDLSQADFSGADIRGANFTNTSLIGSNFSNAKAGLKISWLIILGIGLVLLAALTGVILGYSGAFPALIIKLLSEENAPAKATLIGTGLIVMIAFCVVIIQRGLGKVLGIITITVAATTGMTIFLGSSSSDIIAAGLIQAVIIAIAIAGILIGALTIAVSWLLAEIKFIIPVGAISILSMILGAWESLVGIGKQPPLTPLLMSCFLATGLFALSSYISLRAIIGDKKFALIHQLAINISSRGGTRFRGANLTDANFSGVTLPYTDFRKAILKRTSWFQSSKLELSRLEGTYLEDLDLRHLLISRDGEGNIYDYKNLQGLNLQAANLVDASFIGADFSEANLQAADLSRAKLVKTRLYGAELTHACLSGACIQDWAISTDTHLEQITCTHVYMRLGTPEDPDPWRKPDNRNETFQGGDFTDFVAPIIKTLDLYRRQNVDPRQIAKTFKSLDFYHYGGIDPAAAAIAFQQLAEENPEARLEIVALEGRGEEKIRLQAAVTGEADSSQLNVKYFEKYHEISSLSYPDIQTLLAGAAEKDERIHSLEKLLENALQQPKYYVETYQNQGEFIMSQSKGNVNISGVQGNVSGVAAAGESQTMTGVAIGAISGSVTNTINQLPASPDPDNPGIKELLAQLQAVIEAESELPDEDKVEALEQVKTLAEAGQKPKDNVLKKAAKTSIKILKGTVATLPDATKLVEACTKLLPAIATLLALV